MIILSYKKDDDNVKKEIKKKNDYIIIFFIILTLIAAALFLLINKNSLIDNIIKDDNYEISAITCDGATKILDKKVLKNINNYLKNLNNNGPFLGDLYTCYQKIIVNYDNDLLDIEIINKSSIIIKESKNSEYYTYYTNADKLNNYLSKYFKNN